MPDVAPRAIIFFIRVLLLPGMTIPEESTVFEKAAYVMGTLSHVSKTRKTFSDPCRERSHASLGMKFQTSQDSCERLSLGISLHRFPGQFRRVTSGA